jgi:hypothetical protein
MLIHKKQLREIFYFLTAAVVGVAVGVALCDLADFFDVCVRLARFFVSVFVVSPVKYDVTFFNNVESDHETFFGST